MLSIGLLAIPDCLLSGIVGPLEILIMANTLMDKPVFGPMDILSTGGAGSAFGGLALPVRTDMADASPDLLIIPPIFDGLDAILKDRRINRWLRQRHAAGTVIATACAGSFLLAETGALNGRTATTHWKLVDDFRRRYPEVDLQPQMMLIDGGGYVCAGGAMAWQDLALHLVARYTSPEIASHCAKVLVMDGTRHVQTPYFIFEDHRPGGHQDPAIREVQKWIQENYQNSISLDDLAARSGLGVRTFQRHFRRATGQTVKRYLQQLRIEAARHLLEVSERSVDEITALVGYSDSASFRRLFKKRTGLTPREYRNRFSSIARPSLQE